MKHRAWFAVPLAAVALAPAGHAANYLSVEEAQKLMFASATRFDVLDAQLTPERARRLDQVAGVQSTVEPKLWTVRTGDSVLGYFALHHVIGKQEYISYAVALNAQGRVTGVEILAYRESHGYEIRNANWRAQFNGKGADSPLQLEQDVVNISGATLSSRHVTEGVKRIVMLVDMIRKGS